jgi:phage shock protein C
MNVSDEIKRLHELHQAGALSDADFARAKEKVLAGSSLDKSGGAASSPSADLAEKFKRLRRSRSDRWLAGVCGGLARVSGMDSWVWRLLFVLLCTVTFGFGLMIYILLWFFVPEEQIGN